VADALRMEFSHYAVSNAATSRDQGGRPGQAGRHDAPRLRWPPLPARMKASSTNAGLGGWEGSTNAPDDKVSRCRAVPGRMGRMGVSLLYHPIATNNLPAFGAISRLRCFNP
jgi:hypothetical protein